jgi:hypothetical protein
MFPCAFGYSSRMNAKRPTNSELRLGRLEVDDAKRTLKPGILELFHRKAEPDEDAPIARDLDASTDPESPS